MVNTLDQGKWTAYVVTPYARKGEKITCENGHEIATIAHTVYLGDPQHPKEDFVNWKQPEPLVGTMVCPCTICGAKWFDNDLPQHYHFENGWR